MEEAAVDVSRVEKKGKGKMVGILVALVLVLGAGAAGAVFAPRLLAKGSHAEKPAAAEGEEPAEGEAAEAPAEEEEHGKAKAAEAAPPPAAANGKRHAGVVGEIVELAPIIVDVHASDNSLRHMKVQLVVEMPPTKTGEEFKKYVPFAREASISYLRTQDFDKLSDPKSFDTVRSEIEAAVIESVGKGHARRVMITDFVVQ
jgi:flagellar basal body-associated protein FliL